MDYIDVERGVTDVCHRSTWTEAYDSPEPQRLKDFLDSPKTLPLTSSVLEERRSSITPPLHPPPVLAKPPLLIIRLLMIFHRTSVRQ